MKIPAIDRRFRKARLCAGLSAALALNAVAPWVLAGVVQNCGDGGAGSGSLRDVIENAPSGDTIDLSQLPAKCGMIDSVITLSNGEIGIAQDDLKLQGPSSGSVTIKPEAGGHARIFNHYGHGLLVINDLTLTGGKAYLPGALASGGCIASLRDVLLARTSVYGCATSGDYGFGGGVYARGSVALLSSKVSFNSASGSTAGDGEGIFAWESLTIIDSTLSGNSATAVGGGAYVYFMGGGSTSISYSTFDNNAARYCAGAAFMVPSVVSSSTISYNAADRAYGGLCFFMGQSSINNSTIAFNSSTQQGGGVGVKLGAIDLQSTIMAFNDSGGVANDLYVVQASGVTGSDNLIMSVSSNVPPGVVKITSDPRLGPLRFGGGRTRTHALLPGSPAISAGNNSANVWFDQRGRGYPRMTGATYATDIGAFQFDSIFAGDFQW